MSHKIKVATLSLIPVILIVTTLLFIRSNNRPEPMTTAEVLAKKQWTKQELAFTLARNFKPQADKRGRKQIITHLSKQLQKLKPKDRDAVKIMAIRQAITDSIKQYRALKPDSRSKMVSALTRRAERNYKNVAKMDSQQRHQIRQQLNSELGRSASAAIHETMYTKLSPDERRDFAPIEKIWIKTIEKL